MPEISFLYNVSVNRKNATRSSICSRPFDSERETCETFSDRDFAWIADLCPPNGAGTAGGSSGVLHFPSRRRLSAAANVIPEKGQQARCQPHSRASTAIRGSRYIWHISQRSALTSIRCATRSRPSPAMVTHVDRNGQAGRRRTSRHTRGLRLLIEQHVHPRW